MKSHCLVSLIVSTLLFLIAPQLKGVDLEWSGSGVNGVDGTVYAMVSGPDGSLYIGGDFLAVGKVEARNIARWDGTTWHSLGTGISGGGDENGVVNAICFWNGQLIAGGDFSDAGGVAARAVAAWDGTDWSPLLDQANGKGLGPNVNNPYSFEPLVNALAVRQGELVVGGRIDAAGIDPAYHLATWDGLAWRGIGINTSYSNNVATLAVVGNDLIASGDFVATVSGQTANRIARWNGAQWYAMGSGLNSPAGSMVVKDGELYLGGSFTNAGGNPDADGVARWSGGTWQALGTGVRGSNGATGNVQGIAFHGDALFTLTSGLNYVNSGTTYTGGMAKWENGIWSRPVAQTVSSRCLLSHGGKLVIGGTVSESGESKLKLAEWDGVGWEPLAGIGFDGRIGTMVTGGGSLYVAGQFSQTPDGPAYGIARWDGSQWHPLGTGVSNVSAMAWHDGKLYVGCVGGWAGSWDGTAWQALGSGLSTSSWQTALVLDMTVWNGKVCYGGSFAYAGGVLAHGIAAWNGNGWESVGIASGPSTFESGYIVKALAVTPTGLVVAGNLPDWEWGGNAFLWNGTTWNSLGLGSGADINDLHWTGDRLVAAGFFFDHPDDRVRVWQVGVWSSLSEGLTTPGNYVDQLGYFRDVLWLAGPTSLFGDDSNRRFVLARHDGIQWVPTAMVEANDSVFATPFTEYEGDLWVGGEFSLLNGEVRGYIARGTPASPLSVEFPDGDKLGPAGVDFGTVGQGGYRQLDLRMRNDGTEPLAIQAVSVSGLDALDFQATPGFILSPDPFVLAPGAEDGIQLRFEPSALVDGPRETLLSIELGGGLAAREFPLRGLVQGSAQPVFLTQPASMTVGQGATVILTVSTTGSEPVSYQWYDGNSGDTSSPISGATSATFQTPALTGASRSYWVSATNEFGTVDSATAVITLLPPRPVITSWLSASGYLGLGFSYQITATNSTEIFAAIGLPPALSIDSESGLITGTLTELGVFDVEISATNSGGTGNASLSITCQPLIPPPTILSPIFAAGYVDEPLSIQVSADPNPTSFSLINQPGWISIDSEGLITGTPTTAGTYSFRVRAANESGFGPEQDIHFFIETAAGTPTIISAPTYQGVVNQAFDFQLVAGLQADSFSIVLGDLPPGISLDPATGALSGTPTIVGDFDIVFVATNEYGGGKYSNLRITIHPPADAPAITSDAFLLAPVGIPFAITITSYPLSNAFVFENLPAWLLQTEASGEITGTPTIPGIYEFDVVASNGSFSGPRQHISLRVTSHPDSPRIILHGSHFYGYVGSHFQEELSITPDFSELTAEGLPPGIILDSASGVLSGFPTQAGEYSMVFQASNANGLGEVVEVPFTVTAVPDTPRIPSGFSEIAFVGVPFQLQLWASTGFEYPVLSWFGTGLPAGLSLDTTTGLISGTPLEAGLFSPTVSAASIVGTGPEATVALRVIFDSDVPRISSPASAETLAGAPVTYQIVSSGGPISAYQAENLPLGLSINAVTGLIEGTVSAPGTYDIRLSATNAYLTGPVQIIKLSVAPVVGAPILLTPKYISISTSQEFSYEIPVTGMPDRPWPGATGVFAENLPHGMALNSATGVISGFPTIKTDSLILELRLYAMNGVVRGAVRPLQIHVRNPYDSIPKILSPTHVSVTTGNDVSFSIKADRSCDFYDFTLFNPYGHLSRYDSVSPASAVSPILTVTSTQLPMPGILPYEALGMKKITYGFFNRYTISVSGSLSGRPFRVDPAPGSPVITSPDVLFASAGKAMNVFFTASGSPTQFAADSDAVGTTAFPNEQGAWAAGTSFNSSIGQLSGTPIVPGTYSFLVRAMNGVGWSLPKFTTLVVLPVLPILPPSPIVLGEPPRQTHEQPTYQVGLPLTLTPSFDNNPDYFIIRDLPPGLAANEFTGEISGIPETPGHFSIKIRPFSGTLIGAEETLAFTILPADGAPAMAENIVINGTAGTALDHTLTASPAPAGFNFSGLPDFVEVDPATGHVTGTPFYPGTYQFTVSPFNVDGEGFPVSVEIIIAAAPGAPVVGSPPVPPAKVSQTFSLQLSATGTPDLFDAGVLPYGLHLNSETGLITGTPLVPGEFEVPFWAVNSVGIGNSVPLIFNIEGADGTPVVTNPSSIHALIGQPVAIQFASAPAADLFTLSPIPDGFTFDPVTGLLTGPGNPCSWTFTLSGSNSLGQGTPKTITLTVSDSPSAAWLAEAFGEDAGNPAIAGWNAIPYGDGIPNLIKYALGLHPSTPDLSMLPSATTESFSGQTYLVFTIRKIPTATDVTYTPEISSTLAQDDWNSGPAHLVVIEDTPELLKVRDTLPLTSGKRFVRLNAAIDD